MNFCAHCSAETANPKFCGRSCSTAYNNIKYPRRTKTKQCLKCDTLILASRTYCSRCSPPRIKHRRVDEVQGLAAYQVSTQIRGNARLVMGQSGRSRECRVCGYNTHVEVSHIRAISSFPPSTLVGDINDLSNLEYLCPNHHWEHETGLL